MVSALRALGAFSLIRKNAADEFNRNTHCTGRQLRRRRSRLSILQKQFEHFRATVPLKDKRVVLKPNLVEWHRDKVINTDPHFISAVIEMCKPRGGGRDHRRRGAATLGA